MIEKISVLGFFRMLHLVHLGISDLHIAESTKTRAFCSLHREKPKAAKNVPPISYNYQSN